VAKLGDVGSFHLQNQHVTSIQKKDSSVFYETCYYNKSDDDISIVNFDVRDDNEEYVLSMPCENAILDDHDDTLSREFYSIFEFFQSHHSGEICLC
jgi:hypothetical protein